MKNAYTFSASIFFCVVIIFIYFSEMKLAQMDVLRSSGVSKSLWYIKKENETWKVTFIREHP